MPTCYFLAVCASSAVDQHTNNVSLFNLVEQINVPPAAPPPPNGLVPVEMHAYWLLHDVMQAGQFDVRFVMVAGTGLETPSAAYTHRVVGARMRSRTMGLPYPPVLGSYTLRIDWRLNEEQDWHRELLSWPISLQTLERRPQVTH